MIQDIIHNRTTMIQDIIHNRTTMIQDIIHNQTTMIQGITQNRTTMIQHYNILYATGLQWYKVLYGEYEGMQVFLPSGHPPSHHQNGHGYVRFHHLLLHDILTSWPPLAAPRPFVTEYRPNINISKIAPDLPISVPFMMIILIAVYKGYVEITPANDDKNLLK